MLPFEVVLPLEKLLDGKELDDWFPVRPCKDCAKATGKIRVKVSFAGRKALSLADGQVGHEAVRENCHATRCATVKALR